MNFNKYPPAKPEAFLTEALVSLLAFFHPRPFVVGFGPAWVAHAANNSMPSTHVTVATIMAIVLAMRKHRRASVTVLALAAMLAWARIYIGIHWPADMVGAVLSAIVSVVLIVGVEQCFALFQRRRARSREERNSCSISSHSSNRQPP